MINILERLQSMSATPQMWGSTRETFGLQLVLLAEIIGIDSRTAMKTVFGPGPSVSVELLTDEWAKAAIDAVLSLCELVPRRLD